MFIDKKKIHNTSNKSYPVFDTICWLKLEEERACEWYLPFHIYVTGGKTIAAYKITNYFLHLSELNIIVHTIIILCMRYSYYYVSYSIIFILDWSVKIYLTLYR